MKFTFFNKLSHQLGSLNLSGTLYLYEANDSAVQERLRDVIELNRNLGRELGVENLERLHAERALLKREHELLKATEDGTMDPSFSVD